MKEVNENEDKTNKQTEPVNEKLEFLKNAIGIENMRKLAQKDPDKIADILKNWLDK